MLAPAEQSSLQLLIRSEARQVDRSRRIGCERHRARNQTAVIPPVEADPGPSLPGLVLQVSRLVELFVVVDTEGSPTLPYSNTQAAGLGWEETGGDAGEDYQGRKSMDVRHAHTDCVSRNLGIVPTNREEDRGRGQDAEIVARVRVTPNVISTHYSIATERLLQTGMEFIAIAGFKWCVYARDKRGEHRRLAPGA